MAPKLYREPTAYEIYQHLYRLKKDVEDDLDELGNYDMYHGKYSFGELMHMDITALEAVEMIAQELLTIEESAKIACGTCILSQNILQELNYPLLKPVIQQVPVDG